MYSGTYQKRLDAKGRVALPARMREELAKGDPRPLVVTFWEFALYLYNADEWSRVVENASRMPSHNRAVSRFNRTFFGHASEVEPDGQGRILIPPTLRERAHLHKEVVVAGFFRHVELWDRDRWQQLLPTTQEEFDEISDGIAEFNLLL